MKIFTCTWSYDDITFYKESLLYKSFIKNNNEKDIINIHYNRNKFASQEKEFSDIYGHQHEYLLYKIQLLRDKLKEVEEDILIYADTNDVVCLKNINEISFPSLSNKILFSSEIHQYPNECNITDWPIYTYKERCYLNSGLFVGLTSNIIKLLEYSINNILPLNHRNFGGDQGIYTYNYLNKSDTNIFLDKTSEYFLSTYHRAQNTYRKINNTLINVLDNTSPAFIHDNGWNYGSPKFIEHFSLL